MSKEKKSHKIWPLKVYSNLKRKNASRPIEKNISHVQLNVGSSSVRNRNCTYSSAVNKKKTISFTLTKRRREEGEVAQMKKTFK